MPAARKERERKKMEEQYKMDHIVAKSWNESRYSSGYRSRFLDSGKQLDIKN